MTDTIPTHQHRDTAATLAALAQVEKSQSLAARIIAAMTAAATPFEPTIQLGKSNPANQPQERKTK